MPRVLSDSDLEKIDRDATFRTATVIEPGEILAHMVNALSGDEEGVQGFSDADILESEEANRWTIGRDAIPKRDRATSDVRINIDNLTDTQWTWSGNQSTRRAQDFSKVRHKR